MFLNIRKSYKNRKKQKGISMVDIAIWAAVAIGVVTLFVKSLGPVLSQNRARDEITDLAKIFANVQAKWANSSSFDGITIQQLIDNSVFPNNWVKGGDIINRWGGRVTVDTNDIVTTADSIIISSEGVPKEECLNIVPGVFEIVRGVEVGGTTIKNTDGSTTSINMGDLGTACSSAPVTIRYIVNKG